MTHFANEGVITQAAFSRTCHDCLESGGLRYDEATDIERMNHVREPHHPRLAIHAKTGSEHFKGHAAVDVRETRAIEVEPHSALRALTRRSKPQEPGVAINKTFDEPCAGHPINPKMLTGSPNAPLKLVVIQGADGSFALVGLTWRQHGLRSFEKVVAGGLRSNQCVVGEEVNCGNRFKFLTYLAHEPGGLGEADAGKRFPGILYGPLKIRVVVCTVE